MVQCGVVAAWGGLLVGEWGLATALLVANAVSGFDWFGRVAGSVVTEAPGARAWMDATSRLAGGGDLMDLPPGVDLVAGTGPGPRARRARPAAQPGAARRLAPSTTTARSASRTSTSRSPRGELVLLLGQVGSGKSSLLGALAGLVSTTGEIRWNDRLVEDPRDRAAPGAGLPRRPGAAGAVRHVQRQRRPRPRRPGRAAGAGGRPDGSRRRGGGRRGVARRAPRRTPLRRTGAAPRAGPRGGGRRRPAARRRRLLRARRDHRDRAVEGAAVRRAPR